MPGDLISLLSAEGDVEDKRSSSHFGQGDIGDRIVDLTKAGQDADGGRDFWQPLGYFFDRYKPGAEDARAKSELVIACREPGALVDETRLATERGWERCESPIERILLPWLTVQRYAYFDYAPLVLFPGEGDKLESPCVAIVPQLPVGRRRIDFAIAGRRGGTVRFLGVECDGSEFHEKERDENKDREVLASNRMLAVVRLTGSEIIKDPKQAAQRVAFANMRAWQKPLVERQNG